MIPVLRTAQGVKFDVIAPAGFRIMAALDHATQVIGQDLTITAGTNDHATGRHTRGEAFDVRTKDLTVPTLVRLMQVLMAVLGPLFTVLYEVAEKPDDPALAAIAFINADASGPHLHIQPKKGTDYPPIDDGTLKA